MSNTPFPNVRPEPTSRIPAIASNNEYERYIVIDCPGCGGEAYAKTGGGMKLVICRQCEHGTNALVEKSNYGRDWDNVRRWVLQRDNHQCRHCGDPGELHVHHIKKLVLHTTTRRAHRPSNLITLCKQCHRDLEGKPPEAFDEADLG